jgi:1,4-dihydroxy-2-naphthoate octaprenyltransferase
MFIYCYTFFEKVRSSAVSLGTGHSISVHVLATGWILLSTLWLLPDPYGLVALLSIVFLIPVQQAANRVNESLVPGHERNERFTALNIVAVVIGGLLLVSVVIGTFVLRV